MKTIALIHPKIDYKENYPCHWLPFSVLAVASGLPEDRFRIRIFDEHIMSAEQINQELAGDEILVIGISIMTGGGQIENGLGLARLLRRSHSEAAIAFGGPHVNVLPEQTSACDLVDYALCGMGQHAFAQLALALDKGLPLEDVPGLYYRVKERVVKPRQPWATGWVRHNFRLIDPTPYIRYDATIAERTLNYISSQGCPYACRFCYESAYRKKYYPIPADIVLEDIQTYVEEFHVNGIKFYDADFFANKKNSGKIMEELKDRGVAWAASIHPKDIRNGQRVSRKPLLRVAAESGCSRLLMGMESGSERILTEIINKHAKAADYLDIARAVADYGILGSYTFMVGFPGETEAEYEETFSIVRRLWDIGVPLETKIHIYLPYPGTPLFKQAVDLGFKYPARLEDWSSFNYYKAMTPWTDSRLEERLVEHTKMIEKNEVLTHESIF